MTEGYELAFVIGGLFLSLTAFSLIFGDNFLFRLGAAILGGAVAAYVCGLIVESYFYPLIMSLANGTSTLSTSHLIRAAAVVIAVILLFCRAYTGAKTGGRLILTVLLSIGAALMILGTVGGTIPAFIKSISAQFRLASLSEVQKNDVWYWAKSGTVLAGAVAALLYTRHYDSGSKNHGKTSGTMPGNLLIGFTFGAVTAAVFRAAANILVNHISGIIGSIQSLLK